MIASVFISAARPGSRLTHDLSSQTRPRKINWPARIDKKCEGKAAAAVDLRSSGAKRVSYRGASFCVAARHGAAHDDPLADAIGAVTLRPLLQVEKGDGMTATLRLEMVAVIAAFGFLIAVVFGVV
jgi:hypothetical protein